LVVVSGVIISVQEFFGISVEKTGAPNQLIQFFQILLAPLVEEIGFRVMLIGLPLFALYSCKSSLRFFVKSLWRPWHNLDITDLKKPLLIIIIVAIFFGISHVISGEAWSVGKFAQATVSGLIIGWVYFRYGLAPAILIHWAANYFIYSYAYIVADINKIPVETAFAHSLLNALELTLIATGVISIVILVLNYVFSKKHVLEV
jgi:membrane protease YdiL (CAAX protease family)